MVNSSIASQICFDEKTVADLCHFLLNMDMYMEKKTLQGLRKNIQSKIIFKDHIDHVSTDVQQNNNHGMVRGVIFSRHFTFQISSFNTK